MGLKVHFASSFLFVCLVNPSLALLSCSLFGVVVLRLAQKNTHVFGNLCNFFSLKLGGRDTNLRDTSMRATFSWTSTITQFDPSFTRLTIFVLLLLFPPLEICPLYTWGLLRGDEKRVY